MIYKISAKPRPPMPVVGVRKDIVKETAKAKTTINYARNGRNRRHQLLFSEENLLRSFIELE
jgi:hypothetical protein